MARNRPIRALVTGGAGFIGRHLVARLLREGYAVSVADRIFPPETADWPVTRLVCDVRDAEPLALVVNQTAPEVVFHLAGLARGDDLAQLLSVNLFGTRALLDTLRRWPIPPLVVIPGSSAEYGQIREGHPVAETAALHPTSAYGLSKVAQSLLGVAYSVRGEVPVIVGRVFNITGPGEPPSMLLGAMAEQIVQCEAENRLPVLQVGNLSPIRDFLDVRDAARALWLLSLSGRPSTVYNICSGQGRCVEDVVRQLAALCPMEISLSPDPARQRPADVPYCVGNPGRLRNTIGWIPEIPFEESLTAVLSSRREALPLPVLIAV